MGEHTILVVVAASHHTLQTPALLCLEVWALINVSSRDELSGLRIFVDPGKASPSFASFVGHGLRSGIVPSAPRTSGASG